MSKRDSYDHKAYRVMDGADAHAMVERGCAACVLKVSAGFYANQELFASQICLEGEESSRSARCTLNSIQFIHQLRSGEFDALSANPGASDVESVDPSAQQASFFVYKQRDSKSSSRYPTKSPRECRMLS